MAQLPAPGTPVLDGPEDQSRGSDYLNVKWDPVAGATGYHLTCNGNSVTVGPVVTSTQFSSLPPNQHFNIVLRYSVGGDVSDPSAALGVFTRPPTPAPPALAPGADARGADYLWLAWQFVDGQDTYHYTYDFEFADVDAVEFGDKPRVTVSPNPGDPAVAQFSTLSTALPRRIAPNTKYSVTLYARDDSRGGTSLPSGALPVWSRPPTPPALSLRDPYLSRGPDFLEFDWTLLSQRAVDHYVYDLVFTDVVTVGFPDTVTVTADHSPPITCSVLSTNPLRALQPNVDYSVRLVARDDARGGSSFHSYELAVVTRPPTPATPSISGIPFQKFLVSWHGIGIFHRSDACMIRLGRLNRQTGNVDRIGVDGNRQGGSQTIFFRDYYTAYQFFLAVVDVGRVPENESFWSKSSVVDPQALRANTEDPSVHADRSVPSPLQQLRGYFSA